MSEYKAIDKAQESVDHIVSQLCGYKVPAYKVCSKFLEAVLNHNGFNSVKIEIDVTNMYKPTVIQANFEGESV